MKITVACLLTKHKIRNKIDKECIYGLNIWTNRRWQQRRYTHAKMVSHWRWKTNCILLIFLISKHLIPVQDFMLHLKWIIIKKKTPLFEATIKRECIPYHQLICSFIAYMCTQAEKKWREHITEATRSLGKHFKKMHRNHMSWDTHLFAF